MTNPLDSAAASAENPIRVMVVDDSAVIRGFLTRFIETDPDVKVIMSASNGQMALSSMERHTYDVVVLDIEMPVMDGMTALPLILKADPNVQVVMASTLTKANASITLKAFEIGAAECLAKPTSSELAGSTAFRDDLVHKVKSLGLVARSKRSGVNVSVATAPKPVAAPVPAAAKAGTSPIAAPVAAPAPAAAPKKFTLRSELVKITPEVIAIGSSTGGPQALLQFFSAMKGGVRQPIFVTQHMPPTFTTILAEHISKQAGLQCHEATEGDVVQDGHIYLAPGNYHMTVKEQAGKKVIALNQEPQENFCRPAVDPMLRSIISVYNPKKILAVIFTGMGADGLKSCQQLVLAGGTVLAQDEATSVVWGMPGAVAMANICTQVLPLGQMAQAVCAYADRGGVA